MKTQEYTLKINIYQSINELNKHDINLINAATGMLDSSYSPYSKFKVGAAAVLEDGRIIQGSNQENSSFGVTLCAERVLLATYSNIKPKSKILAVAITYKSKTNKNNRPLSPCGICRQALSEIENMQDTPIRLLMCGQSGKIWEVHTTNSMLPLAFDNSWFSS